MLDLVVRDGPARDDARLLRKSDLFAEELGHAVKLTVARPVVTDAPGGAVTGSSSGNGSGSGSGNGNGSGGIQAVRARAR
jgi:hypothetical protein